MQKKTKNDEHTKTPKSVSIEMQIKRRMYYQSFELIQYWGGGDKKFNVIYPNINT